VLLMRDAEPDSEESHGSLDACIVRLTGGDPAARAELLALACDRMREIAQRMLRRFPNVRRWDETDDVLQNAAIRLYASLSRITPKDARGLLGLAATHIRRELLDLARKHAGPESYAANHETNVKHAGGDELWKVDSAAAYHESPDQLTRWTRLHEAAASLPAEEKELFHLIWYLDMSQEEAARMLGCSVRTVKRRWDSAKKLLNEAVLGDGDQPR
jgi:RNA polymerase sigma factor (sigma-70 family)